MFLDSTVFDVSHRRVLGRWGTKDGDIYRGDRYEKKLRLCTPVRTMERDRVGAQRGDSV